jgi:hypothetical protein
MSKLITDKINKQAKKITDKIVKNDFNKSATVSKVSMFVAKYFKNKNTILNTTEFKLCLNEAKKHSCENLLLIKINEPYYDHHIELYNLVTLLVYFEYLNGYIEKSIINNAYINQLFYSLVDDMVMLQDEKVELIGDDEDE